MQLGSAGWQALTDSATLTVTALQLTPAVVETTLAGACAAACPAGSTSCPPRHQARSVAVRISGHAPQAPAVARSFATQVRLRNDLVVGSCNS
jgi:type IV pilus assembly protein PilW